MEAINKSARRNADGWFMFRPWWQGLGRVTLWIKFSSLTSPIVTRRTSPALIEYNELISVLTAWLFIFSSPLCPLLRRIAPSDRMKRGKRRKSVFINVVLINWQANEKYQVGGIYRFLFRLFILAPLTDNDRFCGRLRSRHLLRRIS